MYFKIYAIVFLEHTFSYVGQYKEWFELEKSFNEIGKVDLFHFVENAVKYHKGWAFIFIYINWSQRSLFSPYEVNISHRFFSVNQGGCIKRRNTVEGDTKKVRFYFLSRFNIETVSLQRRYHILFFSLLFVWVHSYL